MSNTNPNTQEQSIADLFKSAVKISRGTSKAMENGFKVYKDKIAVKWDGLEHGDKVLVKITNKSIIFIKSEEGNRTLTSKGTDGRLMLSLNKEMKKLFNGCFEKHKVENECETLELKTQTLKGVKYYILETDALTLEQAKEQAKKQAKEQAKEQGSK